MRGPARRRAPSNVLYLCGVLGTGCRSHKLKYVTNTPLSPFCIRIFNPAVTSSTSSERFHSLFSNQYPGDCDWDSTIDDHVDGHTDVYIQYSLTHFFIFLFCTISNVYTCKPQARNTDSSGAPTGARYKNCWKALWRSVISNLRRAKLHNRQSVKPNSNTPITYVRHPPNKAHCSRLLQKPKQGLRDHDRAQLAQSFNL